MGGAVEEGKRLLLAINDLRGGAGGGKVRGSAEGGVGDAGGQRRPPIKRNLLLTQLSRQQRYRQAEGDRERLGQSARVRDSRQLLKAVPAEKLASRPSPRSFVAMWPARSCSPPPPARMPSQKGDPFACAHSSVARCASSFGASCRISCTPSSRSSGPRSKVDTRSAPNSLIKVSCQAAPALAGLPAAMTANPFCSASAERIR